jgi:UV DNA damage repair endonuclease
MDITVEVEEKAKEPAVLKLMKELKRMSIPSNESSAP